MLSQLSDYEALREKAFLSFLKQFSDDIENLVQKYRQHKDEINDIIQQATAEQDRWKDILRLFDSRFLCHLRYKYKIKKMYCLKQKPTIFF